MASNTELMRYFPNVSGEEIVLIGNLVKDFSEEEIADFSIAYNANRKTPMVTLLLDLFLGGFGVHRFYLGQVGLGVLYLFTLGFLGIGSLIDLFRFGTITNQANMKIANEIAFRVNTSKSGGVSVTPRENAVPVTPAAEPPIALPASETIAFTSAPQAFAQREMQICGMSGTYAGQNISVGAEPVVIGRDPNCCSIVIQDSGISRRHAHVYADGNDGVIVEDLGSTNGTFVEMNGAWTRISSPTRMTVFMHFRLGESENEFEVR
ncbi:MAG: NINE protein [Synergistes sp.]|nr:NINE protein [Synergistes sp.]